MEQFNSFVNDKLSWMHENKYVLSVVVLVLALYANQARPNTSNFLKSLLKNPIFRLFMITAILYTVNQNLEMSVIISIVFLLFIYMFDKGVEGFNCVGTCGVCPNKPCCRNNTCIIDDDTQVDGIEKFVAGSGCICGDPNCSLQNCRQIDDDTQVNGIEGFNCVGTCGVCPNKPCCRNNTCIIDDDTQVNGIEGFNCVGTCGVCPNKPCCRNNTCIIDDDIPVDNTEKFVGGSCPTGKTWNGTACIPIIIDEPDNNTETFVQCRPGIKCTPIIIDEPDNNTESFVQCRPGIKCTPIIIDDPDNNTEPFVGSIHSNVTCDINTIPSGLDSNEYMYGNINNIN